MDMRYMQADPPGLAALLLRLPGYNKLTERERQVFGGLIRGKDHKTIGQELGISYRTVGVFSEGIIEKLCVKRANEIAFLLLSIALVMGEKSNAFDRVSEPL